MALLRFKLDHDVLSLYLVLFQLRPKRWCLALRIRDVILVEIKVLYELYSFFILLYRLRNGRNKTLKIANKTSYLIGIRLHSVWLILVSSTPTYYHLHHSPYFTLASSLAPRPPLQVWVTKGSPCLLQVYPGTV